MIYIFFYRSLSFWQNATSITISPIYNLMMSRFSYLYPQMVWITLLTYRKVLCNLGKVRMTEKSREDFPSDP